MPTDITTRLRELASHSQFSREAGQHLMREAAEEIERLRKIEFVAREYVSQFGDDDGRKDDTDLRAALNK